MSSMSNVDWEIWHNKEKVKGIKKKIDSKSSCDPNYWERAVEYASTEWSLTALRFEKASDEYDIDNYPFAEFLKSDVVQSLLETLQAWDMKKRIYKKRVAELEDVGEQESNLLRLFPQPYDRFPLNLNVKDAFTRYNFRCDIIKDQGLRDPRGGQYEKHVWNIFTGKCEHELHFIASHIFAWKLGQELMTTIYGSSSKDGLFSSANGLFLPIAIKGQFDNRLMAIVPDIEDLSSQAELTLWMTTHPHGYKIKIIDDGRVTLNDWPTLDICVLVDAKGQDLTTRQLDGMKLQFPACSPQSRPAARYLYFHYCCQLLRQAWKRRFKGDIKSLPLPVWEKELANMFAWGTVGKYFADGQMRGYFEELGCEFEELKGYEMEGDEQADRYMLVEATAEQIIVSNQTKNGEEEEEDSDEDDEDEDDDEAWMMHP